MHSAGPASARCTTRSAVSPASRSGSAAARSSPPSSGAAGRTGLDASFRGRISQRWTTVVVHHSATDRGSASAFDRGHRGKGWDELGYHFVIGNGRGSGDGQIEVGSRWYKQKHGAHCKTPDNYFNEHGIGVCLVGDFTRSPTHAATTCVARPVVEVSLQPHGHPGGAGCQPRRSPLTRHSAPVGTSRCPRLAGAWRTAPSARTTIGPVTGRFRGWLRSCPRQRIFSRPCLPAVTRTHSLPLLTSWMASPRQPWKPSPPGRYALRGKIPGVAKP